MDSDLITPDIAFIPLDKAALCENCDCIVRSLEECPACGGTHMLALAPILNRKPIFWPPPFQERINCENY